MVVLRNPLCRAMCVVLGPQAGWAVASAAVGQRQGVHVFHFMGCLCQCDARTSPTAVITSITLTPSLVG